MRIKRVLLATTALAMLAGVGEAQAGGLYVGVFGGANWAADSSANFTDTGLTTTTWYRWDTDADTGFVLGATVGTHLDKWAKGLRVELEASYRRNDVGGGWAATEIGTTPTTYTFRDVGEIDANLSTFAIMANLWYECDMGWKIRPYAGGGAGWGRAKFDGVVIDDDGLAIDQTFDLSNDGFAWQLGLGFNYQAMPGVDVGLGYRYTSLPDFVGAFTITPDFAAGRTFGRVENENHAVMVNLSVDIN